MWIEHYNELTNMEKERFASVSAFLLNKGFVTREIYENKSRLGKINPDYRFIERHYNIFEGYFKMLKYRVENNEMFGFFFLENDYNFNRLRLDKLTTLVLFTLRTLYEEEREKNSTSDVVFLTVGTLIFKLLDLNLVPKKPTIKEMTDSLRILVNHNIISRIEGSIDEATATIAILPTILHIVSNEKISAIYEMVFGESDQQELKEKLEEELEDFDVFDL